MFAEAYKILEMMESISLEMDLTIEENKVIIKELQKLYGIDTESDNQRGISGHGKRTALIPTDSKQ